MNNIDLKVADTRCDAMGSYAKFVFIRRDHPVKEGPGNSNDKADGGDQCGSSATIDNPLS